MKTYSRDHWEAALDAWRTGGFSDEWKPWRHQAAMRGILYPPEGTRWDSWEDDDPSERAILIRAIRETPALLSRAIEARSSWAGVIAYIVRERDDWRAQIGRTAVEWDEPDPREASVSLKRIIERIGAS